MLTKRQYALYSYLISTSDKFVHLKDIADAMIEWYPYDFTKPFNNTNARRNITRDIQAINKCDELSLLIISCGQGVKIATSSEYFLQEDKELMKILRELKRYHIKKKKAMQDGQYTLDMDYIRAFIDTL